MNVGIILAAGVGSRFGSDKPKQFYLINGKPIVYHTLKSFVDSDVLDHLIVVLSVPYFKIGKALIKDFPQYAGRIHICEGGNTRQDSLYYGVLKAVEINNGKSDDLKVVSHCAARPLLPSYIIQENLDKIKSGHCANTVRRIFDTMLYANENAVANFIDRDRTFVGLTPQSFIAMDYLSAYDKVKEKIKSFTCACSLMTGAGYDMDLIISEAPIHKITVKSDINLIKQQIKENK